MISLMSAMFGRVVPHGINEDYTAAKKLFPNAKFAHGLLSTEQRGCLRPWKMMT